MKIRTADIQTRAFKNRGHWQPIKDRDRHRIPRAIRRDFDQAIEAARAIRTGFNNAHTGSQNAHSGSHHARASENRGAEPTPHQRL